MCKRQVRRFLHAASVAAVFFGFLVAPVVGQETAEVLLEFRKHSDWVRTVAFSPDGTRVVTGGDDCSAMVWRVPTGAEVPGLVEK